MTVKLYREGEPCEGCGRIGGRRVDLPNEYIGVEYRDGVFKVFHFRQVPTYCRELWGFRDRLDFAIDSAYHAAQSRRAYGDALPVRLMRSVHELPISVLFDNMFEITTVDNGDGTFTHTIEEKTS